MARPDDRPLLRLKTLAPDKDALERCAFCPKLCRSACPVSNVEPRETLTPWGKMSMAYFAGRGDVPSTPAYAAPAWACTGCYGCRTSCDHRNDVATTLLHARAGHLHEGTAPLSATRAIARFPAHEAATTAAVRELALHPRAVGHVAEGAAAKERLLVGCTYVRGAPREARHALEAASRLAGPSPAPVSLVEGCCGLPLLHAGDAVGFARHAARFAASLGTASRVLVVDAGCAQALRVRYPEHGVTLAPKVELLVEVAADRLQQLKPVAADAPSTAVRYHDPCQLGRGLGVYDAPRAVLARALGRPPLEFTSSRDRASCSGGGGMLPASMPKVAVEMAAARVAEHEADGGGRIVTACASSLLMLRRRHRGPVDDLVTWMARAARAGQRGA